MVDPTPEICCVALNEGEVVHVKGKQIVVVYDTGDDLIEQHYEKKQFTKVPQVGDRITITSTIVNRGQPQPEPKIKHRKRKSITGDFRF